MRPALLVVASLLAGCREGIELEILADSTTTRVEVFLAAHAPLGDVTELAPENAERIEGIAFPRNLMPDGTIEPKFTATVGTDGRARLELEPDADHTLLYALIAVGLDANNVLVSAAVLNDVDLSNPPLRVIVELAPVSGEVLEADVASAQVWGRPEYPDAGCVGITTVDPATGVPATQFIVTEGDPDCDRLVIGLDAMPAAEDTECDDRAYLGSVPVGTKVLHADERQTCRPFSDACVDGQGVTPGVADPVCLPDALCLDPCASGDLVGCIGALRTSTTAFAHLRCVVPVEALSNPSTGTRPLCTAETATSDLGNLFTGGVECKELKFATVVAGTIMLDPRSELVLARAIGGNLDASIAAVDMTTDVPLTSACTFVLRPNAAEINNTEAPRQVAVLLTKGDPTGDKVLVLPVLLRQQECIGQTNAITCTYVAGDATQTDGIEVCARAP